MFKKSISDLVAGDMYRILNSEEHARLFKKAYRSEDDDNDAKTCKTCKHDKDMCMCGDMSYVSDEDMSWAEDDNFAAPMAPAAKPMTPPPAAPKPAAPAPAAAKKAWHNGRGYRKYADDLLDIDHDIDIDSENVEYERMMSLASKFAGGNKSKPCLAVYAKFRNKPIVGLKEIVDMISGSEIISESERKELISYIGGIDPYSELDKKAAIAAYSALEDLITASAALDYANFSKASELALKLASLVSQAKKEKMSGKSTSSTSKKPAKKPTKKPMKGKKPASSASSKSTSSSSSKSTSSSSSKSSKKMTMKEKMEMLRSKRK